MTITDNENFNNFALPIEQVEQMENNSSDALSSNNKAKKLERCNSSDNYQNNNFTITNTPETIDECALIFNIIFLICGCMIFPVWACSCCYLTNPNPSVRFIAKINVCLLIIPCIFIFICIYLLFAFLISTALASY